MNKLAAEKEQAVFLRKHGATYKEILTNVRVSKSTLSLWLRSVSLSTPQRQAITQKRLDAAKKGALKRKEQRITTTLNIKANAIAEISSVNTHALRLIGATLYWAEGAKAKVNNPSQRLLFSNSDPRMICIYIKWLTEVLQIQDENISFQIYLNETTTQKVDIIRKFWSLKTGKGIERFTKIYYKRGNTGRKKYSSNYYGQLRIGVKNSTNINRQVEGWIDGICKQCGVV